MKTRLLTLTLAILILLMGFALAAATSRAPFERLPHLEDEIAFLWQAKLFATGRLSTPSPEPYRAYWQPFVVDHDGMRFSKYPPGWPLLLASGVLLGPPWITNAFLTALTLALVYRLGKGLFGAPAGVLAALLTATSPLLIVLSGSLMSHTAATFWSALLLTGIWRLTLGLSLRRAVLTGFALGMLINTRPLTAVGITLPFALAAGVLVGRWIWRLVGNLDKLLYARRVLRAGPLARRMIWSGIRLWWRGQQPTASAAAVLVLVTLGVSLLTPLHNAAATGDPFANLYTLVWAYDRVGFGPDIGRVGFTPAQAITNLRHDLNLWTADLSGWTMPATLHDGLVTRTGWWLGPGLSWLLPLGALVVLRRKRWAWLLAGVFFGLAGVHLLYWGRANIYGPRYYAEATPALALLSAGGVLALPRVRVRQLVIGLVVLLCLGSLLTYTPARWAGLWRHAGVGGDQLAALETLRDGRPALILVTGEAARSWRDWGTYMALTSPLLDSDVVAARYHGWPGELDAILARFPDRQVLELTPAGVLLKTFDP